MISRFGKYTREAKPQELKKLSEEEKRGLLFTSIAGIIFTIAFLLGTLPTNGFLREAQTGDLLHSPFHKGAVSCILLGAMVVGVAYGLEA